MRPLSLFRIAFLAIFAWTFAWHATAQAQTGATPQQIQGLIASGQESTALGDLNRILQNHPNSGVAWYLVAEAQDASGNPAAARSALAKAEQYAPGLPFAQPAKVAALQAHLAAPATQSGPAGHGGFGISPVVFVIGGLVVLFILIRMFFRSRRSMPVAYPGYPNGYGQQGVPPGGPFPYGPPGGMPYGGGGGMFGGGGGSLLSGLAAGAGFAAGERAIDGLMGDRGGERPVDQAPINDPPPVPDRDDGLNGSPGWGDGDSGQDGAPDNSGDFDPNNSW